MEESQGCINPDPDNPDPIHGGALSKSILDYEDDEETWDDWDGLRKDGTDCDRYFYLY